MDVGMLRTLDERNFKFLINLLSFIKNLSVIYNVLY